MKVVVKDYSVRGRHFVIVKHQDVFCAVEDKYIDENGKLNKALRGVELHPASKLEDCLNYVKDYVEVEYLVSQGHSRAEAFCIYWDRMDMLAQVEEVVGRD